MDFIWILLIAALVGMFIFIYFYTKNRRQDKAVNSVLENLTIPNMPVNWANSEATDRGMRVIWNGEVFNSEEEKKFAFRCFDVGFENAFNAMQDKYPTWDFNPAFVNIGIVEPTAKAADGYEALLDKSGRKIGGAVIGTGDKYPLLSIIIPSQKANGWSYPDFQMRIIWYEYEHFQEYRSDTIEFLKYSGTVPEFGPDNHPHHQMPADRQEIPAPSLPNTTRSFVSSKNTVANIECGGAYVNEEV